MCADISTKEFDKFFKTIVQRTCMEWGYEIPQAEYFAHVWKRLPLGLREIVELGLSSGLINDIGLSKTRSAAFRPIGVSDKKGPYSWFSRDNQRKKAWPNWEYFVQLSEFIRLYEAFKTKNVELRFEDDLKPQC